MNSRKVELIKRADIPSLHTVTVDNREHLLGILKDFRKNPALEEFLPPESHFAAAWVHLGPGQVLDGHLHPIDSMIIVCHGRALVYGEVRGEMEEGDILLVPRGHRHGFVGAGSGGFWGLSIQFAIQGLYEDAAHAQTVFLEDETPARAAAAEPAPAPEVVDGLAGLLARNQRLAAAFDRNPLFDLARSGVLQAPLVRERFLDCFQVWSDYFQRMVQLRAAVSEGPGRPLAEAHLHDELGHNLDLARGRSERACAVWDPVLESTGAWFAWRMMSLTDAERIVLVHLVIESAAAVFYSHMRDHVAAADVEGHVSAHLGLDDEHVQMGVRALETLRPADLPPLLRIQEQGWAMLECMFARMGDLAAASGRTAEREAARPAAPAPERAENRLAARSGGL
jgi:quercetin dioxygenase-like cupin family protein